LQEACIIVLYESKGTASIASNYSLVKLETKKS
jgi:hypothetical protein